MPKNIGNEEKRPQPMRPLAHVSIDDQTLFTALMMTLANKIESLQGDPSIEFKDVHARKVINYGNRLHCNYMDSEAKYSWGNSNVYSKYFKDYQKFLARPLYFGREAKRIKTNNEEVYEIHLDFSKFYDSIDRDLLVKKISLVIKDINDNNLDESLDFVLKSFKDWEWTSDSIKLYDDVCKNDDIKELNCRKGIPQGLVAGGFFANIYMLDFDTELSSFIGDYLDEKKGILLIDACRYVDDLRLIVKCDKYNFKNDEIADNVILHVNHIIKKLGLGLNLQNEKTKVKKFNFKEGAVSNKLADIQSKVSGPISLNELDEQLGHLEGLIELSDNLNDNDINNEFYFNDPVRALATIDKSFNDVRKDTLLRFTANKIHTLLKQKRNMISQDVNDDGIAIPGSWDCLQEKMSRKLISRWSKDPSLLLLLKKGIELFPHVQVLKPILQNLDNLHNSERKDLKYLSEYCISEILRHSATVIHVKDRWGFPAHSDVDTYFEYLESYANDKLNNMNYIGVALREQLRFFCLIRNDSILLNETEGDIFNFITCLLNGVRNIRLNLSKIDYVTCIILSYQISMNKNKVVKSICSTLENIYKIK